MILTDLHLHTCFCDGKNTPDEMVQSAIQKGLKTVGILAHSYLPCDAFDTLSLEKTQEFIDTVNALKKKYAGQIKVLLGIEIDHLSKIDLTPYDYIIGSVHYLTKGEDAYSLDVSKDLFIKNVNIAFGGDYYLAAENYFSNVANIVETTGADIIAHFDLITKFNEKDNLFSVNHPRYIKAYQNAVDKLIPYGKPFEINTGVISRGHRSKPYPSKEIVEYIKQKGGKFILSSDAHSKDKIAFEFEKWQKEYDL